MALRCPQGCPRENVDPMVRPVARPECFYYPSRVHMQRSRFSEVRKGKWVQNKGLAQQQKIQYRFGQATNKPYFCQPHESVFFASYAYDHLLSRTHSTGVKNRTRFTAPSETLELNIVIDKNSVYHI